MVDWLPVLCPCADIGVSSINTSVSVHAWFAVNDDNFIDHKRLKHEVGSVSDPVEREGVSKCKGGERGNAEVA